MRFVQKAFLAGWCLHAISQLLWAQKQEVGLTLGSLLSQDHTTARSVPFTFSSGTAFQADYEYRVFGRTNYAFYIGAHFLANPQRTVESFDRSLTRDVATIYITPGLMVKLFPTKRVTPWAAVGGGYGDYEQSTQTLDGRLNTAPREIARGVFHYGGGIDVPVWKFIAIRGEVRDFYTGTPAYNSGVGGGQHNVVAGGGIVLRFGGL